MEDLVILFLTVIISIVHDFCLNQGEWNPEARKLETTATSTKEKGLESKLEVTMEVR